MKIGVEVQIDVTKIDKARLYQGQKGKYLTMTTFIDIDQKDQYDNNGFISHKKNKDEQENPPILGNVKVFWSDQQAPQQQQGGFQPQQQKQPAQFGGPNSVKPLQQQAPQQQPQEVPFDDDVPF